MKKTKSLISALLVFAMLFLSACGDNPAKANNGSGNSANNLNTNGRWVEKDITPEENSRLFNFTNANGQLICFNKDLSKRYTSDDNGDTWTETDGPNANNLIKGTIRNCALLDNGTIIAVVNDPDDMVNTEIIKIDLNGNIENFILPYYEDMINENGNPYISNLIALPNNRIYIDFASNSFSFGGIGGDNNSGEEEGVAFNTNDDGVFAEDLPNGEAIDDSENDDKTVIYNASDEGVFNEDGEKVGDMPTGGENNEEDEEPGSGIMFYTGSEDNKTFIYDVENEAIVQELSLQDVLNISGDGQYLYALNFMEIINKINIENGETEQEIPINSSDMPFYFSIGVNNDELLLFDGSDTYKLQEKEWELYFSGTGQSVSNANTMVEQLTPLSDGSVLFNALTDSGSKLFKYYYDENATFNEAKSLNVWSLEENIRVRATINEYCKNNPDAYINYEVALSGDSGLTVDDVLKKLNTRLLANDAPDIIILDGCPVDSYIEKGVLKELTNIIDTGAMYENLYNSTFGDGPVYFIPSEFTIPLLLSNSANKENAESLEKLCNFIENSADKSASDINVNDPFAAIPEEDQPVFSFQDYLELFNMLWNTSANELVKDNAVNKDALEQFLTSLKTISDKYGLFDNSNSNTTSAASIAVMGGSGNLSGAAVAYGLQTALLAAYTADDLLNLDFLLERKGSQISSFPGLVNGAWIPKTMAAISTDTKKEDAAVEFIQTFLSDEVQAQRLGGLPVSKSGAVKMIDYINELEQIQDPENYEEFIFDYDSLVGFAKTPIFEESVVKETIAESSMEYCSGKIELTEAVGNIETNLKNYLAEKR